MLDVLRRLARGSLTYGAGSVLQSAIAFLLIPVYTRYLSTSDYGIVAVAGAVTAVLAILLGMGLRGAVVRHYYDYRHDAEAVRRYLGTVLLFFLGVGVPVVALLTVLGEPLFAWLFRDTPFDPYIRLALWSGLFTAAGGILLGLYRAREQARRYVAVELGQFALALTLILALVVGLRMGALGKVLGDFAAGLLVFLVVVALTLRESTPAFSVPKLAPALAFGLPLVPHLLAGWALASADRVVLERLMGLEAVGLYTLGYQVGMVMSLVVSTVNAAWSPIFYDLADSDPRAKESFARVLNIYVAVVALAAAGTILFARDVVQLMAAPAYHAAHVVVPAVAVGYLFQGLYFMSVTPLFYVKRTGVLPLLTGGAAVANVALNALWIPRLGILGAAYATTAAFALLAVATHAVSQRHYRIPYAYRRVLTALGLVGAVYGLNAAAPLQGLPGLAARVGVLLAFAAALFLLRVVSVDELRLAGDVAGAAGGEGEDGQDAGGDPEGAGSQ